MVQDVAFDPVLVGLFGAIRVVFGAKGVADTFDKLSASLIHEFFAFVPLGMLRDRRGRWSGRGGFRLHCVFSGGYAKIKALVNAILTYDCLKSQINLGIRIRDVDKELGRKTASETLVRQFR